MRIRKARAAFTILLPVWRSKAISRKTMLWMFNTKVLSVLLYGSEKWRITKATSNKLQSFVKNLHSDKRAQVGLDRAHPQKTDQQCHQTCIEMKPTEEEEPRPSQEQLEENRGQ